MKTGTLIKGYIVFRIVVILLFIALYLFWRHQVSKSIEEGEASLSVKVDGVRGDASPVVRFWREDGDKANSLASRQFLS
jgi:hypothetical protein